MSLICQPLSTFSSFPDSRSLLEKSRTLLTGLLPHSTPSRISFPLLLPPPRGRHSLVNSGSHFDGVACCQPYPLLCPCWGPHLALCTLRLHHSAGFLPAARDILQPAPLRPTHCTFLEPASCEPLIAPASCDTHLATYACPLHLYLAVDSLSAVRCIMLAALPLSAIPSLIARASCDRSPRQASFDTLCDTVEPRHQHVHPATLHPAFAPCVWLLPLVPCIQLPASSSPRFEPILLFTPTEPARAASPRLSGALTLMKPSSSSVTPFPTT